MSTNIFQSKLLFDACGKLDYPTNAWDFSSKNTLYATHGCHTYVASMNPYLARTLLSKLVPHKGNVLDPFVGGGAVLVESLLNNIPGEGIDVNPLSVLITKVKTTYLPFNDLFDTYKHIIERFSKIDTEPIKFPPKYRIDFWFKPNTIASLSKLAHLIQEIDDKDIRDAFNLIFSATVRDVSLTYRGEIRLRRLRGEEYEKFNPNVLTKFKERAEFTIRQVSTLPRKRIINVQSGDATEMIYDDNQFSTIITSPPYGDDRNGVGYFQFSKNMLFWLNFTDEEIRARKSLFLGENKTGKSLPDLEILNEHVDRIKANPIPSNPNAVDEFVAFYHDYQLALNEMSRVCSGKIAIVIGDRRLSKTFVDNAAITTALMNNIGYSLDEYHYRIINKKRIPVMKPGGGQRDVSGGGLINKEHTLIYSPRSFV